MTQIRITRRSALALGGALATLSPRPGAAQAFPSRPIRIIVPFGPGSGTDIGTRLLGQHLQTALGQPIVVENRPGANGSIAAQHVASAPADGYTLLMGTNSTHGANSAMQRNIPYDPVRDFAPVAAVGIFPGFLVVHPSVPATTPEELVAYGKANPGALTYAVGNTTGLMMAETFLRRLGIEAVKVVYPSNPPALTDVVGGRVSMMFPDVASSLPFVRSGRLRALGVVTLPGRRSASAPELPVLGERMAPGLHTVGWIGLFAPAATPPEIVARLSEEVRKVLATPAMREAVERVGAEPNDLTQQQFRSFVVEEVQRTAAILRELGIQPE